jgi:hypothetical protein
MKIAYDGTDYEFDQQAVTIDEWRALKRKYSMTPGAFQAAVDEADPDASTFLYWVMLRQNGKDQGVPLSDNIKLDIVKLNNAFAEAVQAEAAAAKEDPEPDPTTGGSRPDGTTSASTPKAAAATSAASGNGSSSATSSSSGASTSSSSPGTADSPAPTSDD